MTSHIPNRHQYGRSLLVSVILVIFFSLNPTVGAAAPDDGGQVLMGKQIEEPEHDQARSTTGPRRPADAGLDLPTEALGFEQVTIAGVPRYLWYNGCGPTAAGMVIGYWDGNGFDDLVPGDASVVTPDTEMMVSSTGNYYDYCLPMDSSGPVLPDLSEEPVGDEHADDSVADFMKTSQSYHDNKYGWSWDQHVDDALLGYTRWANLAYDPTYARVYYSSVYPDTIWFALVREIDAGHPAVFLVDTNGDGWTDHFVTVVGYDTNRNYGLYDTWDTEEHWYPLAPIYTGTKWGVYAAHFFTLEGFNWTPGVLDVRGTLLWSDVEPGDKVTATLDIENVGAPESGLFWRLVAVPEWGTWEFDPAEGLNLKPEEGVEELTVSVVAPNKPRTAFSGTLLIVNAENPETERFEIEVSLTTGRRTSGQ